MMCKNEKRIKYANGYNFKLACTPTYIIKSRRIFHFPLI